jgi:hypothetical protein
MVWINSDERLGAQSVLEEDKIQPFRTPEVHANLSSMLEYAGAAEGSSHALANGRIIRYGDVVVLQNAVTGLVTVPFLLRAINGRNKVIIDPEEEAPVPKRRGDPISQLHKMCFQVYDRPGVYLGLDTQNVAVVRSGEPQEVTEKIVNDIDEFGIWTVVGVDQAEYSFWLPPSYLAVPQNLMSSTDDMNGDRFNPIPVPTVYSVRHLAMGVLQLTGSHFSGRLRCFLGDTIATRTTVRCAEVIDVDVSGFMDGKDESGKVSKLKIFKEGEEGLEMDVSGEGGESKVEELDQREGIKNGGNDGEGKDSEEQGTVGDGVDSEEGLMKPPRRRVEPILLVRDDGVVYRSGMSTMN